MRAHAVMAKPAVTAAWTPAELSLKQWMDATDAASFTFSSGTLVSQWDDLSGNAKHWTQATSAKQPSRSVTINGLDAVDFDGVDNEMLSPNISASQPLWIWAVFRTGTVGAGWNQPIVRSPPHPAGVDLVMHLSWSGGADVHIAYAGGTGLSKSPDFADTTTFVWGAFLSGTSSYERINGAASTTGSAGTNGLNNASGFQVMAESAFVDAALGEFIVVDGAMTGDEITALEAYFTAKWGTP